MYTHPDNVSLKQNIANGLTNVFRRVSVPKEIEKQLREEIFKSVSTSVDGYISRKENELKRREDALEKIEHAIDVLRKYLHITPKQYL